MFFHYPTESITKLTSDISTINLIEYYVSPSNSKNQSKNFLNTLNDEICNFSKKGTVFIQGDLNARTGVENDFLCSELDEEDPILGKEVDFKPNARNSEDKKTYCSREGTS